MKKLSHILIGVFSLVLIYSCAKEKKKEEKFLRPVKYTEVAFSGKEKVRTFSGTAETDKIIKLSFRNSGIISQFDIKLGQKVKKGQLLAKLDNVQARLSLEQAVTQLNSGASQMNTSKLSLDRTRKLYEKGSASLSNFESAKNAYKTAKESYESAKRSVSIQEEQVRYGYIYAPEDGVIAEVTSEIEENVSTGQTVATLNAGRDMEIALGIPESVINVIKEGMEVVVSFSSLNQKTFKAKVTEVSPAVNTNTATYPVRVMILDPTSDIKSGMSANVTFDFRNKKIDDKRIVIPANAVGEDSKGRFVFTINSNENKAIVKKQYIKLGELTQEGFEVLSGLTEGQKIATAGLQTLLDGQEVKL